MSCCGSCSSSALAIWIAAALSASPDGGEPPAPLVPIDGGVERAGRPDAGSPRPALPARPAIARIAVFPPVNLTGGAVELKPLGNLLQAKLAGEGLDAVGGDALEPFLSRHRIRYTGGVDREVAAAAGSELGVAGILVTSVDLYQANPPDFGASMRLVSADRKAEILWAGGAARAFDDEPGWFDLGIASTPQLLEAEVFARTARALAASLSSHGPHAMACADDARFLPKVRFRSAGLDSSEYAIAVLPFQNESSHPDADDLLALQFVRQLRAIGNFRVLEPGVVRSELLHFRIVMDNGISLDTARVILELLHADLVIAGIVRDYRDALLKGTAPSVEFTVFALERQDDEVVWESTSHGRGDDQVLFFDVGRVSTAPELACRMVRAVVRDIADPRPPASRAALRRRR